ncbi:MAG: hypothetical protein ABFC96_07545 [Thermoguttaceae bacterium]
MRKPVIYLTATFVAFAVMLAATSGWATVTLTPGNNPQPGEENVLLDQGATGSTVTGATNQTGTVVDFTSSVNTLFIPSSGQAMIQGVPETGGINQIVITVPGFTFTDLIFNAANTAQIGTPGALATVDAAVNESGGGTSTFTGSYNLGQGAGVGNGFATLVATGGETMSSVTITLPSGEFFHDLEQVRVSGLAAVPPAIPEPASLIVWSLFALIGVAIGCRRK